MLNILINCFTYGILRNGIVCYIPVPKRSGYHYVIRMIAFGIGQMRSGFLCVEELGRQNVFGSQEICVICL